jgi:hypothetical protein
MYAATPLNVLCLACTVCGSTAGQEVRAGFVKDDVAANLLAVVLPFVASAGVVALVHFCPAVRRRQREDQR